MSNYRDSIEIYECVLCGTKRQSVLDVDHIDGNHSNHAPENLQTLCKFCHRFKTRLDRKGRGLYFSALIVYCADITSTRLKIRSASTEWYELYGNKYKGDSKFSTNIEDILDAEDMAKIDEIYRKQLLIWIDTEQYMDGNPEQMKIHPKNQSTTFTFLYDLVLKNTYNTAWLDNIFKDEIIDDKLIFTFSQKNSKDYFLKYYWNHSYWQKSFRPFLKKLIKTVYGKDYRIFVKVRDYIAPEKKYIRETSEISSKRVSRKKSRYRMSNNERYPFMYDFEKQTKLNTDDSWNKKWGKEKPIDDEKDKFDDEKGKWDDAWKTY